MEGPLRPYEMKVNFTEKLYETMGKSLGDTNKLPFEKVAERVKSFQRMSGEIIRLHAEGKTNPEENAMLHNKDFVLDVDHRLEQLRLNLHRAAESNPENPREIKTERVFFAIQIDKINERKGVSSADLSGRMSSISSSSEEETKPGRKRAGG